MSFSFDINTLTLLELVGMALAIIGFFNLSEKLEKMFAGIQARCTKITEAEIRRAKRFWPPHKNIKPLLIDMAKGLPYVFIAVTLYVWWKDGFGFLWNTFQNISLTAKILTCVATLIILLLNELFTHYVLSSTLAVIAKAYERMFHILGKPPSGVTGSLGLLLSLASFMMGHITAAP